MWTETKCYTQFRHEMKKSQRGHQTRKKKESKILKALSGQCRLKIKTGESVFGKK